jgi:nitrogen fixation/metabolism regulation signal transduction histidine kinase
VGDDAAGRLWCTAFQRLVDRAAHEVRNPLNGAAVNLEVLRSRSGRLGVDPATLTPFAEAAASELVRVTGLVEALLALARPTPSPVDLDVLVHPLVVLYRAVAVAGGGTLTFEREGTGSLTTDADPAQGRAVLAAVLDAAVTGADGVRCALTAGVHGPSVTVARSSAPVELPAVVRDAARQARLGVEAGPTEVRVTFPAPRRGLSGGQG